MSLSETMSSRLAALSLAALSLLACVEKLSSLMNTISIERDWVIVIAQGVEHDLQEMNAQMRRIDLFCKLVGPLAIAVVAGFSTEVAILITLGMTCVSVGVEYIAIAKVYQSVQGLHESSHRIGSDALTDSTFFHRLRGQCLDTISGISTYVHHPALLPSLSLSLLYLTVFSFGGQMVTYLLSTGLTSTSVGLFRTLSTILELSATWLAPRVMDNIGPIRGGIWFLNWQLAMVALSIAALWIDGLSWKLAGLLTGVILSRVGLWGFDLSAQMIIQEVCLSRPFILHHACTDLVLQSVEEDQRGSFSATEASVQSMFELLSFASTIVFARPEQFKYPAAISGGAVLSASILYACFVRMKRGHLFHASKCMKGRDHAKWHPLGGREQGWSEIPQHAPDEAPEDGIH